MKSLSLYIDKWFISVAINQDGNVLPLSLPNGEDRIWLYFHEDIANSRIEYGKAYENCYRDKQPHYFGDIFNLIEKDGHYFTRYDGRREEMKKIFKVSGIFNHLHHAINEENHTDTYISFSADIPDVARLRFIKELEEAKFNVIESVARISHLALEECKKRNVFVETGVYLVLVATNDNFHFSLYENKGNIFLRKNEGKLSGLGLDVRRRALVEAIVENINKNSIMLKSREEIDMECLRQDRFASAWLDKIAKSRPNIPVAFDNITFAVAPNNPQVVQILPDELNNRTNGIVDDIIRKVADFVKQNQLQPHEIKGIAFIGNTFTNPSFTRAIDSRFTADNDMIVTYREEELPKVVSVYSQIDCSQFKEATANFHIDAETQETLNRQAKEEEEKRRKAEEEDRRQQELIDSQKRAKQEYENAVENIERHESDHNYKEMLDWTEIALAIRPDDEYAKEKAALAHQLYAEQKAENKQFNANLSRAKKYFSEGRWTDAVSQCDIALELRPNDDEVLRLKAEASRQMEIKDKIQTLLNRADIFLAQKLYAEALNEAKKILGLDPSNNDANEIERKIARIRAQYEEKVGALIAQISEAEQAQNYAAAISICETLIEEDSANIRKWTQKKESLMTIKNKFEENKRLLSDIRQRISDSYQRKDWNEAITLCQRYLEKEADKEIEKIYDEAKSQLIQQEFNDAVEAENWSNVIDSFNTNRILRDVPSNLSIIRFARNQLRIQKRQHKQSLPASLVASKKPSNKTPEMGSYPRLKKRIVMPNTLLEDSLVEISSEPNKRQYPRPKRRNITASKDEEATTFSEKTHKKEIKKRKYPKVSRNK